MAAWRGTGPRPTENQPVSARCNGNQPVGALCKRAASGSEMPGVGQALALRETNR